MHWKTLVNNDNNNKGLSEGLYFQQLPCQMHSTANPWTLSKVYSVDQNYLLKKRNLPCLAYVISYYVYSFFPRMVNSFLIKWKIHSRSSSRVMTFTILSYFWMILRLQVDLSYKISAKNALALSVILET